MSWQQRDGAVEIEGRHVTVTLEERPKYCDRGRYIAKVHCKPDAASYECYVDGQDCFPRYYFFEDCAKREIEQWLKVRGQI